MTTVIECRIGQERRETGPIVVPWSNNQYLDDLLPNSEIHPLDAGHFAWEQAAEKYGRLVVDWVSGGEQSLPAGRPPRPPGRPPPAPDRLVGAAPTPSASPFFFSGAGPPH